MGSFWFIVAVGALGYIFLVEKPTWMWNVWGKIKAFFNSAPTA